MGFGGAGFDASLMGGGTISGDLVITGDLTVQGTDVILQVDNLDVEDVLLELGVIAIPTDANADGGGVRLRGTGGNDKDILWSDARDAWEFNQHVHARNGNRVAAWDAGGTDYIELLHDGAEGLVRSSSGDLELSTASQLMWLGDGAETVPVYGFRGAATASVDVQLGRLGGAPYHGILSKGESAPAAADYQVVHYVSGSIGRHLILTDSTNKNQDHGHGSHTNPTLYIHSVNDPEAGDNTQWVSLHHATTGAYLTSGTGPINLDSGSASVQLIGTAGTMYLSPGGTGVAIMRGSTAQEQFGFFVRGAGSTGGRQFIIGDYTYATTDHAHALQTNPTLYVHSARQPGVGNPGEFDWGSLVHDQTDFLLETGAGAFRINSAQKERRTAVVSVAGAPTPDVYTVLPTDYKIGVDTTLDAVDVNLQTLAAAGADRKLVIKDEGGNAGVNNIRIVPNGVETIDGVAAALVIAVAYAAVTIYSTATGWFIE